MSKAIERANDLYPNSKSLCGGVASIARDAFTNGWKEALEIVKSEIKRRFLEDYNSGDEALQEMDETAQGVLASLLYYVEKI